MRWLGNLRLIIVSGWKPTLLAVLLMGCKSTSFMGGSHVGLPSTMKETSINDLSVLTWVGGLCILFGVVSMVLPFLSTFKGGTALTVGILLILLNVAIKEYQHWIYVPVLIGAAAVTVTAAYKTVRYILNRKKSKCLLPQCPDSSGHSGSLFWWPGQESSRVLGSALGSQSSSSPDNPSSPKEEVNAPTDKTTIYPEGNGP